MSTPSPRPVVIVPHTHWDREWYLAFQTFRMKLVDLLDDLLPTLEADPSYAHFMLDGQMAVLDDYLAIRPEAEDRLRRLAASGRLGVGPWSILMDEFLVSGETIVRNLQRGLERAAAFGGAMEVGYLPDMFGHIAQMPQILRGFGFEHAVVWRGVPSAVDRNAFTWIAPDGTAIRAEYLPDGYWNGQKTPDDAKALVARLDRFAERWDTLLDGPVLWMNGMDHELPQPWLGRVVAEANDGQDRWSLRVGSLASYLADAPNDGLPTWHGELRSGARCNLLMGVVSNRTDVRQAAAAAERWIERVAEPAAALFQPVDRWPEAILDQAWTAMIRNSAHDSSCACSIDEVVDAVLVRYAEARQIGEGVAARAAAAVAATLARPGEVVVNTTSRPRSGLIETQWFGTEAEPGMQHLGIRGGVRASAPLPLPGLCELLVQAVENAPELTAVELLDVDDVLQVRLFGGDPRDGQLAPREALAELRTWASSSPERRGSLAIVTPERQKVLAYVHDVPGFGWARWEPEPLPVPEVRVDESTATVRMTNGLVAVEVDVATGTFAIDGVAGFGRLVDDGDVGDTYNWCPPDEQQIVDVPISVAVRVVEPGPLRARVEITTTYELPAGAEGMVRRVGSVTEPVVTVVELQAGSPAVRISHDIDNLAADHRLRAWLPLPRPAASSRAECAFAVVERGLLAEGGPSEMAMATYPNRRFVCAGGLTVVQDGLLEYELVDLSSDACTAGSLALTLLRCTGLLSQGPMLTRPLPAGPVVATPGAQLRGRHVVRYAVANDGDPGAAFALADDVLTPLLHTRAGGGGTASERGSVLEVLGAEVSAVLVEGGATTVRVVNTTDDAKVVSIPGRHGWLVDLRGRPVEPFEASFPLAPWSIATARLAP